MRQKRRKKGTMLRSVDAKPLSHRQDDVTSLMSKPDQQPRTVSTGGVDGLVDTFVPLIEGTEREQDLRQVSVDAAEDGRFTFEFGYFSISSFQ